MPGPASSADRPVRGSLLIKAVWWLLLAALAAVTVFAELDRASFRQPELAASVPLPFRSFAQQPLAFVAMVGASPQAARGEAIRLVRRRPIPADNLFVLALADQHAGDIEGFRAAFRVATERGWRVPPLQAAAAREALASGDYAAAANRVAALWGMNSDDPQLVALTRDLLADPRGVDAFAVQLARTVVWSDAFLRSAPAMLGPASAAKAVLAARKVGARFECTQLDEFAQRIAAADPRLAQGLACG